MDREERAKQKMFRWLVAALVKKGFTPDSVLQFPYDKPPFKVQEWHHHANPEAKIWLRGWVTRAKFPKINVMQYPSAIGFTMYPVEPGCHFMMLGMKFHHKPERFKTWSETMKASFTSFQAYFLKRVEDFVECNVPLLQDEQMARDSWSDRPSKPPARKARARKGQPRVRTPADFLADPPH